MSTKKKVLISIASLSIVLVVVAITVGIVLAATQHNLSTDINASFTATDIAGTVSAKYGFTTNKNFSTTGIATEDMVVDGGEETTATFEATTNTQNYKLAPKAKDANLAWSDSNKTEYLVIQYKFTNSGTTAYKATVTLPTTKEGVAVYISKEKPAQGTIAAAVAAGDKIATEVDDFIVPGDSTGEKAVYYSVIIAVKDTAQNAKYFGNFKWNLAKVN